MALMLVGSSGSGGGAAHVADSPKAKAAAHAVSRIASEIESMQVRRAARGDGDFDPVAPTRRILRLIRDNKHPDRWAAGADPRPAAVQRKTPEPTSRGVQRGVGVDILRAALAQTGVPYLWGGETPNGFDCSGLILSIARKLGLMLPHSAAKQADYGQPVTRDSLTPGDLVFFADTYKPGVSHVGVYKDHDTFVHASSGHGIVTVGSLKQPYFASRYAGARRLDLGLRRN